MNDVDVAGGRKKNERFSEAPTPPTMTTTRTQFSMLLGDDVESSLP